MLCNQSAGERRGREGEGEKGREDTHVVTGFTLTKVIGEVSIRFSRISHISNLNFVCYCKCN